MTLCFFRFDLQFHVVIMPRLMVWSGAGRDCVLVDLLLSPLTQREIILMFHKSSVGGEMCSTFSGCVLATAMFPIWTVVPCCMSSPLSLSSPLKLSCHVKPWRAKKITQICHVLSPLTPRHHTLKKRRMRHTKHTCDLQKKTQKSILHCRPGWLEWHSFKLFPGNHFVIESAVWKLC